METLSAERPVQRQAITEHFMTALEDVVSRYRAVDPGAAQSDLYAELLTAEVAHQLAVARSALHRRPAIHNEPIA